MPFPVVRLVGVIPHDGGLFEATWGVAVDGVGSSEMGGGGKEVLVKDMMTNTRDLHKSIQKYCLVRYLFYDRTSSCIRILALSDKQKK